MPKMNSVLANTPVGRDSVEPKRSFRSRSNPASGVHIYLDQPTIVFLTVCTLKHQPGLACPEVHDALTRSWHEADSWLVGDYVAMPDHIHLFCAPCSLDVSIEHWIAFWKRRLRKICPSAPRFQSRGFHHRLRRAENYATKWHYIELNPVRAGLVKQVDEWQFRGSLNRLPWW
jgi:putative transposase